MIVLQCLGYVFKQVTRHRVRSTLTIAGVAIAMFLFSAVQAMHRGVAEVTTAAARETTLVVYRENRYCPATSELPQDHLRAIEQIDGVVRATPMMVVVTNCRTSLDVVTFRGVPKEAFLFGDGHRLEVVAGSIEEWLRRTDAALVGEALASRRGLRPGMRFDAAGVTAYVAGVVRSPDAQDQNAAFTALAFVQMAGRDRLGIVTQFEVTVAEPSMLDGVAAAIDERFRASQAPTSTFTQQAFIGRVASDIIELVGFAQWLGLGCLGAVLALVANSIVLSVQSRVSEHAVLQTLGFSTRQLAALIVMEGLLLATLGGAVGAGLALIVARAGDLALSVEGVTIPVVVSASLLASGLLVCGGVGVVAGLAPAWWVSRREIVSCLRAT